MEGLEILPLTWKLFVKLPGDDANLPGNEADLPGDDANLPGNYANLPGDDAELASDGEDLLQNEGQLCRALQVQAVVSNHSHKLGYGLAVIHHCSGCVNKFFFVLRKGVQKGFDLQGVVN